MSHVVLLGDSIFDNASYVPDRPAVIEQLRRELPRGWEATLLAVDGNYVEDVERQLSKLPPAATHLVLSAGGNNALGESQILNEPVTSIGAGLRVLHEVRERFREAYRDLLAALQTVRKPTAVCTIYDAIPGLEAEAQAALASFNEIIFFEAIAAGLPLIDLRLVCRSPDDYSAISPIEPSFLGGAKIAHVIAELVTTHDFSQRRTSVYW